jgi:hypothetical protein
VYESPVNVCGVVRNKSISSFSVASGERCPSLRGHNSRNFCAWVQRVIPVQINTNSMTDSIDNIQERTAGAMSAASTKSGATSVASASMRSAASASTSKRDVLV